MPKPSSPLIGARLLGLEGATDDNAVLFAPAGLTKRAPGRLGSRRWSAVFDAVPRSRPWIRRSLQTSHYPALQELCMPTQHTVRPLVSSLGRFTSKAALLTAL